MSLLSLATVGVIGSAGRKGDARKMSKLIFERMLAKTEEVITQHFKLNLGRVHLVSGGAAWADHVAVTMYLEEKVSRLTLHMPAEWHSDDANPRFHDNSNNNIWNNPGRSANKLHKQFSAKIGEDSLKHLHSAKLMGAKFCKHDGFQARNTAVATASKYLIAFTWNDGDCPPGKGGTHDTWSKHKGRNKIHIPLGSLLETKVPGAIATGGACGKDVKIASCPSNLEVQGDGGYSSQLSLECSQSIDELPECKSPEHRGKKRSGGSLDSAGEPSTSPFKKLKLV